MIDKRFDEWNELKKKLHSHGKTSIFYEREIWWYAVGENIGTEVNGKGPRFSRPMLIIRKYGKESFFGVPLSTKNHSGLWYSKITVDGKTRCALLSQASSYSVYRLYGKMSKVSRKEFEEICIRTQRLLFKQ